MKRQTKIEFKEYLSSTWQDWSEYLSSNPTINKRVESENDGDAGLIVFDTASVEFYYSENNPVHDAFSIDLSNKTRYMFRVKQYSGSEYLQEYEGMADFSSIRYPLLAKRISFDIVDKLSALGVLASEPLRGSKKNLLNDKNSDSTVDDILFKTEEAETPDHHKWLYMQYMVGQNPTTTIDSNTPTLGDVIQSPFDNTKLSLVKYKGKPTGSSSTEPMYLDLVSFDDSYPNPLGGNEKQPSNLEYYHHLIYDEDITIKEYRSSYEIHYHDGLLGLQTINLGSGYEVVGFDGLKIIKALVQSQWSDIVFVNKSGNSTFLIPPEYYVKLIDENPFGTDPLGALKYLADSMRCYIFINKLGQLVVQSKEQLNTNGVLRSIGNTRILDGETNYFWDKLVDGVEVTVNSWLVDEESGEYLQGKSTQTKGAPNSSFYVKPKNGLTREVIVNDSAITTQQALNDYAEVIATKDMQFYGKRRESIPLSLDLDSNTINWDLLDRVNYNGTIYFFTSIELDLVSKIIDIELVELAGHDYDYRQVLIGLNDNPSNSYNSSSSINNTSNISSDFVFNYPLSKVGQEVSLNYSANFLLNEANIFDTIQGIKTTDKPLFDGMILTSPAIRRVDDVDYEFWHSGNLDLTNIVTTDTDQTITGLKTFSTGIQIGNNFEGGNYFELQENDKGFIKLFNKASRSGSVSIKSEDTQDVYNPIYFDFSAEKGFSIKNADNQIFEYKLGTFDLSVRNSETVSDHILINGGAFALYRNDLASGIKSALYADLGSQKVGINTFALTHSLTVNGSLIAKNNNSFFEYIPNDKFAIQSYGNEILYIPLDVDGDEDLTFMGGETSNAIKFSSTGHIGFGESVVSGRELTFNNSYGMGSATFTSGWQGGNGWWLNAESLGSNAYNYHMYLDDLTVRGTMSIWELLVQQIRATNGNLLVTATGKSTTGLIADELGDYYFEVEDITEHGIAPFHNKDIIMCQVVNTAGATFDSNGDVVNDTYLVKRLVYEVSDVQGLKVYVDSLAGAPVNKASLSKGDGFVRIGNTVDVQRRGMVGIYSDEANAPYIRITDGVSSWANWKSQDYMKVQLGKLDGLSDTDFGGALSGYGAYLKDNIYMKGNIVVKSNNSLSLLTNSIMIGNVAGVADNAVKITNNGTSNESGIFGYDNDGNINFALKLDGTASVAGWQFDYQKLFKNNARLEATTDFSGLIVSDGSNDIVKVGDFDYSSITNGMSDITNIVLWESTVSNNGIGSDKWHADGFYDVGGGSPGGTTYNSFTVSVYEDSSDQQYYYKCIPTGILEVSGYDYAFTCPFRDNNYILGRQIKIEFYLKLASSYAQADNDCELEVDVAFLMDNGTRYTIPLFDASIPNSNDAEIFNKTGSSGITVDVPSEIGWNNATGDVNLEIRIKHPPEQGQTINDHSPRVILLRSVKINGYTKVKTFINDSGFEVYNSPSRYLKFRNGIFELKSPELSLGGKNALRYFGNSNSIPSASVSKPGDIYQGADKAFYIISRDLDLPTGKPLVYKVTGTIPDNGETPTQALNGTSEQIAVASDGLTSITIQSAHAPLGIEYLSVVKNGLQLRRNIDFTLTGKVIALTADRDPFNIEDDVYVEYYY